MSDDPRSHFQVRKDHRGYYVMSENLGAMKRCWTLRGAKWLARSARKQYLSVHHNPQPDPILWSTREDG